MSRVPSWNWTFQNVSQLYWKRAINNRRGHRLFPMRDFSSSRCGKECPGSTDHRIAAMTAITRD
jgi:hypothetical protein